MSARVTLVLMGLTLTLGQRFTAYDSCTNPEGQPGSCVQLHDCPSLYALLQNGPRPLPFQVVVFLQRSHCGFQGMEPKVCCPSARPPSPRPPTTSRPRPTTTTTTTTTPRPTNPSPGVEDRAKDVSGEPNLRLLPHDICGPSSDNRIIGGNKTAVFEFPWMARLGYRSSREDEEEVVESRIEEGQEHSGEGIFDTRSGTGNIAYRCGGSLINARYVLTAAHCVEGIKSTEQLVTVRLGEHDVTTDIDCSIISGTQVCAPPAVDFGVEETHSHPSFNLDGTNRLQNDIALVRMDRNVVFSSDAIRPICLPVGDEQYRELDGRKVTVAGWGTTETGYSSTELLQVHVPVVRGSHCVDVYKSMLRIAPNKQMCAGGTKEGDSCNGDSGGPLIYAGQGVTGDLRTMQYGIVSFGPKKCGSEGMPGVYTRVGYYMQWILRNMRP